MIENHQKSTFSTSNLLISELKCSWALKIVFRARWIDCACLWDHRSGPDMISRMWVFFLYFCYIPLGFRASPEEIFYRVIHAIRALIIFWNFRWRYPVLLGVRSSRWNLSTILLGGKAAKNTCAYIPPDRLTVGTRMGGPLGNGFHLLLHSIISIAYSCNLRAPSRLWEGRRGLRKCYK